MKKTKTINGFSLNPIGIGTWKMGSGMYPDKTHFPVYGNEQKDIEAIRYSLSHGQNHIDTAQVYGLGHTEEIVGEAIAGLDRKKIFLASKIWKSHANQSLVGKAVEEMLLRLKTDYLDLCYIHGYWGDIEPVAGTLSGLLEAQKQGLIRGIGVSNFTLEQLQEAVRIAGKAIVAIQNYYSLTNNTKTTPESFAYCRSQGIAFVAAKPIERGLFTNADKYPLLTELSKKYGKTPTQIALYWVIAHDNVHAIPKAGDPRHIEENLTALDIDMETADMDKLESLHRGV